MNYIIFIHGLNGSSKTWGLFPNLIQNDDNLKDYKLEYYNYPTCLIKSLPWSTYLKIQDLAIGLGTFIKNRI